MAPGAQPAVKPQHALSRASGGVGGRGGQPGRDRLAAFCRAVWKQDRAVIDRLLPRIDPDGSDRWGQRPLLLAVQHATVDVVEALLRRGAEVDQGRIWLTPLALAAKRGAADIVALLRRHHPAPSPVAEACGGGLAALRRRLVRDPGLIDGRDEEGTPLLHHAAEALAGAAVQLLLKAGATVDAGDATGETALHRVADLRRAPEDAAAMAERLLAAGAGVDAPNRDAVTPLHQAVRARNLAVVRVLLAHGADANARDRSHGSTPLRRAVCGTGASGTAGTGAAVMAELTRLLLAHGADPDLRDRRGIAMAAPATAPAVLAELRRGSARPPPAVPSRRRRAVARRPPR